ncbi:MAG: hypothetical protein HYT68_01180 [Candidatus Zambryskibacteria bacterium]|nr:hypothetical protein [Candidatus Zambryskibacteria bacterium]
MLKLSGRLILIITAGVVFTALVILLPSLLISSYNAPSLISKELQTTSIQIVPAVVHIETPEPLKAIYMTSCVAGTPSWRDGLKRLIETTELNAVVIDIKDYTGEVAFNQSSRCFVKDLESFIRELHESGIYVIGRVSVFQDPFYTQIFPELAVKRKSDGEVWKDYKGLTFVDVGATPYWNYVVELSNRAYELGFDELNYDYVRYPSDGNVNDVNYIWHTGTSTKSEMLENFFSYLHENIKDIGVKTSVDLFGMTTTAGNDMNIGQVLENALPYFDYISPMVYPSHYPPTWNGFLNPAEYPYEVVKISMTSALEREQLWFIANDIATSTPSKMRPWLQDFHLGAFYGNIPKTHFYLSN